MYGEMASGRRLITSQTKPGVTSSIFSFFYHLFLFCLVLNIFVLISESTLYPCYVHLHLIHLQQLHPHPQLNPHPQFCPHPQLHPHLQLRSHPQHHHKIRPTSHLLSRQCLSYQ